MKAQGISNRRDSQMASRKDDKDERREEGEKLAQHTMETSSRMTDSVISKAAEFGQRQQDQMRAMFSSSNGLADGANMDAVMQSSARLAKGMQDLSWEMMQYTQQSLRLSLKTANEMMTCRSVENMLEIQRDYMRESVDSFLEESAKMLELSTSVASQAVEPVEENLPQQ